MARITAGWHAENIKAELRKRHGTLAKFAKARGLSKQSVSGAITDPHKSARVELAIAAELEVTPHAIWPDRWTEDGRKIDRSDLRRHLEGAKVAA